MRLVRVFVASPGDVKHERRRLVGVISRLNVHYAEQAVFTLVRWEDYFYRAHKTFQLQIPESADCDIVISIFGSRLGSPLPEEFERRLPDGSAYPSGSAYELLSALAAAERVDKPDVFVFRKTTLPTFELRQNREFEAARAEWLRLQAFFDDWFYTPEGAFRRATNAFASTDDFETNVEELLMGWAGRELKAPPNLKFADGSSPFRGLESFDFQHAAFFFGRDRKIRRAAGEWLRAAARPNCHPFLLVVGPSGAGKSSLVRAGIIPRLVSPGIVPEVDVWRIATLRPSQGPDIIETLAEALYAAPGERGMRAPYLALPELADGPYKNAADLALVFGMKTKTVVAPIIAALEAVAEMEQQRQHLERKARADLVLLIDQLEEIFANSVSEQARSAIIGLLHYFVASGRIWVVATLRADLYGRLIEQGPEILALKEGGASFDLAFPGEAELKEILEQSARAAGVDYETDPETGEGLDEVLLREAVGADTLPLLQFSLKELFEQRRVEAGAKGDFRSTLTFEAYRALGGLDGAIDKVAETAIADLLQGPEAANVELDLGRLLRMLAEPVMSPEFRMSNAPGLTVRAAHLPLAAPGENVQALVDLLISARLIVSNASKQGGAEIRLAHERILSSWQRARVIVQAHMGFFRVKADIEAQLARWLVSGKRAELLLSGIALQEAVEIGKIFGDEMRADVRDFIMISSRRGRFRRRIYLGAASLYAVVSLLAGIFALLAFQAEERASGNYLAARRAADGLITSIAKELRQQKDVSAQTLDIIYGVLDDLINRIDTVEKANDEPMVEALQEGFYAARHLIGFAGDDRAAEGGLDRTRADFLYEFALTYHRAARRVDKAMLMAKDSLALRIRGLELRGQSIEAVVGIGQVLLTLSDLSRYKAEQALDVRQKRRPADYTETKAYLDDAVAWMARIYPEQRGELPVAMLYSNLQTRIGDMARLEHRLDEAAVAYDNALKASSEIFRQHSSDVPVVRELAWSYRKTGETLLDRGYFAGARAALSAETCIRRELARSHERDSLIAADLGFALMVLGKARGAGPVPDNPGALDAYYEALDARLDLAASNSSDEKQFADVLAVIGRIAEMHQRMDNGVLADHFAKAGKDIEVGMRGLFGGKHEGTERPSVSPLAGEGQRQEISRGALPLILGETRSIIENTLNDFRSGRLKVIQAEGDVCWRQLTATAFPPSGDRHE